MFQNDTSDFDLKTKGSAKLARNLPKPEDSSELAELRARRGKFNKTVRSGKTLWETSENLKEILYSVKTTRL